VGAGEQAFVSSGSGTGRVNTQEKRKEKFRRGIKNKNKIEK
jgi:hypothetical protein